VVSIDVIFKEGRAFRRSLKSRDSVEDISETQIDVLDGAQPQVSSASVSGVTGSSCMTSGSQLQSIQAEGEENLGS
jgi:hypothetical protein